MPTAGSLVDHLLLIFLVLFVLCSSVLRLLFTCSSVFVRFLLTTARMPSCFRVSSSAGPLKYIVGCSCICREVREAAVCALNVASLETQARARARAPSRSVRRARRFLPPELPVVDVVRPTRFTHSRFPEFDACMFVCARLCTVARPLAWKVRRTWASGSGPGPKLLLL